MLRLLISPYHMTTREAVAMTAMLLGEQIFTLLPVPPAGEGRPQLANAIESSPRYARLLRSWLAFAPLFEQNVISTLVESEDPLEDVRTSVRRVDHEHAWAALRQWSRAEMFEESAEYLDTISADLLKGGPDPGISVPLTAGLDAFAQHHGLWSCRSGPMKPGLSSRNADGSAGSLTQQAEARLGTLLFSVGIPTLVQASARTILQARERLALPLAELRSALMQAVERPDAKTSAAVRAAAGKYAKAFHGKLGPTLEHDDDSGKRVAPGFVSVVARRTSVDTALLAAVAAFMRATATPAQTSTGTPTVRLTAEVVTLTITPMDVALL
jgi:hypothetical protein